MNAPAELSKTKRALNSLVFHSVENGAVVTVFAILNLAFFVSHPHDTIHLCLYVLVLSVHIDGTLTYGFTSLVNILSGDCKREANSTLPRPGLLTWIPQIR